MSRWKITICGKGIKKASVTKLVKELTDKFGKETSICVTDDTPPTSRAERFQEALKLVSDARNEINELKDELQTWFDNLPDNFQGADKGQLLEEAIQGLEELHDELENAESSVSVSFPSMF